MQMTEAVKNAGVVGAGGAGFPTHVKLNTKAEYFLINAAECEPLIETDKYLCRTYARQIVRTAVRIAGHLEAKHAVIALKEKYTREISALTEAIAEEKADLGIFRLRSFYPAGDEQVLVQQVTGRSVPERGLPLDVGCVVENVGTVLAVSDALEGIPVTEKFLSVTGAVKSPVMFRVPIGTPVRDVLQKAGTLPGQYAVILGGPMMGKILAEEQDISRAVVTKTTGNLLVLPKDHYLVRRTLMPREKMIRRATAACIQCRMCTDLCPRYLIGHEVYPHRTMRNLWRQSAITDEKEFEQCFGSAANCCNCGVCEMFACPMGLSPRKMNEYAKELLRERGINPARSLSPAARRAADYHRIPTERLIARLGLTQYVSHSLPELVRLVPEEIFVPLSQHIGKPAVPAVSAGDRVEKGDLIAGAAEGLSANIHAGVDGVVEEVTARSIRISRREE